VDNPCKLNTKPMYSYDWAIHVVNELLAKYARAAEILGEVYGIYSPDLVELLVRNRPEYPIIRDIIHILDRWLTGTPEKKLKAYLTGDKQRTFSTLCKICVKSSDATGCIALMKFRNHLRLEEQGFEGGEGRDGTASRSSPSFSAPKGRLSRFVWDEIDDSLQGRLFT